MHPLIAQFLDLKTAAAVLEQPSHQGFEGRLLNAAERAPHRAKVVRAAVDKAQVPVEAQQALILLATDAATDEVLADPKLGPVARQALQALEAQGASPEASRALVSSAILEEAFGYAETPDHFDAAYLEETLRSLVSLAAVTEDTVDDWLEAFASGAERSTQPFRVTVAEALLTTAFDDGPQPITPEHVDDALEALSEQLSVKDLPQAGQTLEAFLGFLHDRGAIGPTRRKRLEHLVRAAASDALNEDGQGGDDEEDELSS